MRGPRIAAPISAVNPPVMCTTLEPARSIAPPNSGEPFALNAERKPCLSHTQCAITGYTMPWTIPAYTRYATSLHRSATPPDTMVAAAAANVN